MDSKKAMYITILNGMQITLKKIHEGKMTCSKPREKP